MNNKKLNGIFKQGVLLKLSIHGVSDTKRARPNGQLLREDIPPHLVHVNFKIIPPFYINPVRQVESKVRDYIRGREIKIDVPGFHYIPKSFVPEVIDTLKKFQEEYKETANKWLIEKYDEWSQKIKKENPRLNGLIPEKAYLDKAFFIDYSFVELGASTVIGDVLDKDLHAEELEKFDNTMDRAATLAQVGVREEMLNVLEDATKRLGYKIDEKTEEMQKKIFHNTLVKNFQEFWEFMPRKNVFEDDKLKSISSRMQELLRGDITEVSGKLRKKNDFRISVHYHLQETLREIGRDILEVSCNREPYIPKETITRARLAATITIPVTVPGTDEDSGD
jgi:hypothetical protein